MIRRNSVWVSLDQENYNFHYQYRYTDKHTYTLTHIHYLTCDNEQQGKGSGWNWEAKLSIGEGGTNSAMHVGGLNRIILSIRQRIGGCVSRGY